jgi:CRP-like cAMP-binding protein
VDDADLKAIPLFSSLSRGARRTLAEAAEERQAAAGETVFSQGDAADGFYVIVEGELEVERDGRVIGTLWPGGFFGEIALVGDGSRSASVTARSPARLVFVPPSAFAELERSAPDAMLRIREAVTLRHAWDRVVDQPRV